MFCYFRSTSDGGSCALATHSNRVQLCRVVSSERGGLASVYHQNCERSDEVCVVGAWCLWLWFCIYSPKSPNSSKLAIDLSSLFSHIFRPTSIRAGSTRYIRQKVRYDSPIIKNRNTQALLCDLVGHIEVQRRHVFGVTAFLVDLQNSDKPFWRWTNVQDTSMASN